MYICIHVRVHTISFIALNSFLLIPSNEIIFFNYFSITHLYIILLLQLNGSFYFSYTYTYTHTRAHIRTHTRAHIYTYSRTFFHYLLPSPLVVPSLASSTLGLIVSKWYSFRMFDFENPCIIWGEFWENCIGRKNIVSCTISRNITFYAQRWSRKTTKDDLRRHLRIHGFKIQNC